MPKIGLEIHGYLKTNEKLFCNCQAQHGAKNSKPNINICEICTGQPGAKPLLPNKSAIDNTLAIAIILGCKINKKVVWQRKHYDWPDLPKGYQNTISGTYATPNAIKGNFQKIRITEIHLEEDPAAWNPKTGEIDYNRSGSPLIEIVTEPDFENSEQVIIWLKQLITTLDYIKAIDKKSGIKADVNISLPELKGERVEIKNINSLKNIQKAIEYEILRQSSNKNNIPKISETRRFDSIKGITQLMRTKEQAQDYRFISEPDLPALIIEDKRIEKIKNTLPETPMQKLEKLIKKHKINKKQAEILTKNLELVLLTEEIIKKISVSPAFIASWLSIELNSLLKYNKTTLDELSIKTEHLAELIELIDKNKITPLKAQEILRTWIPNSFSPKKELKKHSQIKDNKEIEKIAEKVIKENPKAVKDYNSGKLQSINFLIGQIMKLSDKRADFKTAKEILEEKLKT